MVTFKVQMQQKNGIIANLMVEEVEEVEEEVNGEEEVEA
jgi:hypothetical protein